MTKNYIILCVLVVIFYQCSNQKERIAQKWNMLEMEIAEQKLDSNAVNGFTFDILTDGNYKMTAMEEETGIWSTSGDTLITQRTGSKKRAKIVIELLTSKKMVLTNQTGGISMKMTFLSANK